MDFAYSCCFVVPTCPLACCCCFRALLWLLFRGLSLLLLLSGFADSSVWERWVGLLVSLAYLVVRN